MQLIIKDENGTDCGWVIPRDDAVKMVVEAEEAEERMVGFEFEHTERVTAFLCGKEGWGVLIDKGSDDVILITKAGALNTFLGFGTKEAGVSMLLIYPRLEISNADLAEALGEADQAKSALITLEAEDDPGNTHIPLLFADALAIVDPEWHAKMLATTL